MSSEQSATGERKPNAFDDLLDSIEEYLQQHEDVMDGSDGPRPNQAMGLLTDLRYLRSARSETTLKTATLAELEQATSLPSAAAVTCRDCPISGCPHPDVCAEERERYAKKYGRSSAPSSGERTAAALHACEGLDTADLAGNEKGWLAGIVDDTHRVERDLNSALRARCPGNGDGEDCIVECQLYEASEQRDPCPPGCCSMADEKDVRALMEAIERGDEESPSAAPAA